MQSVKGLRSCHGALINALLAVSMLGGILAAPTGEVSSNDVVPIVNKLRSLAKLKDGGHLSDDEFTKAKLDLLKGFMPPPGAMANAASTAQGAIHHGVSAVDPTFTLSEQAKATLRARTPKLIFFKFHQVAGTTVAETLIRGYNYLGLKTCCEPGCDLCALHDSLSPSCLQRQCLGDPDNTKLVTIMREPVDKAIAKFFFKRLNEVKQNSRAANRDNMSEKELRKERMRQESWNTSPEDLSVDQFFHIYGHSEGINTNKYLFYLLGMTSKENDQQRYWDSFDNTDKRVATAMANLQTFDLIGHKERFDEFITALVDFLGWPMEMLTYKSLKVIVDRPKVTDFSDPLIESIRGVMKPDRRLYDASLLMSQEQFDAIPGFASQLKRFRELQQQVDQSCTGEDHEFLIGKDCYSLTDKQGFVA